MSKQTSEAGVPYIVGPVDYTVLGRRSGRVAVQVHGYWSEDPITIHVQRKQEWVSSRSHLPYDQHPFSWQVDVDHSSGGRTQQELTDSVQAEENFALALAAACTTARQIRANADRLEGVYQAWCQEREQERAREEEARKAKVAADEPLGRLKAETMFAHAVTQLGKRDVYFTVFERGAENSWPHWYISRSRGGQLRCYIDGRPASRTHFVALLAEKSARSGLTVE